MTSYSTKDGDTIELIAWKFYGRQDGRVAEQVLAANPGLADYGPTLPAGVLVSLPELDSTQQQSTTTGVKLWD